MGLRQRRRAADVGEAHRLAAAGIVGDGHHHRRDLPAILLQHTLQRGKVHVALERMV